MSLFGPTAIAGITGAVNKYSDLDMAIRSATMSFNKELEKRKYEKEKSEYEEVKRREANEYDFAEKLKQLPRLYEAQKELKERDITEPIIESEEALYDYIFNQKLSPDAAAPYITKFSESRGVGLSTNDLSDMYNIGVKSAARRKVAKDLMEGGPQLVVNNQMAGAYSGINPEEINIMVEDYKKAPSKATVQAEQAQPFKPIAATALKLMVDPKLPLEARKAGMKRYLLSLGVPEETITDDMLNVALEQQDERDKQDTLVNTIFKGNPEAQMKAMDLLGSLEPDQREALMIALGQSQDYRKSEAEITKKEIEADNLQKEIDSKLMLAGAKYNLTNAQIDQIRQNIVKSREDIKLAKDRLALDTSRYNITGMKPTDASKLYARMIEDDRAQEAKIASELLRGYIATNPEDAAEQAKKIVEESKSPEYKALMKTLEDRMNSIDASGLDIKSPGEAGAAPKEKKFKEFTTPKYKNAQSAVENAATKMGQKPSSFIKAYKKELMGKLKLTEKEIDVLSSYFVKRGL